jgi:hypothetical protein
MRVRIKFDADIVIEGNDMTEVRENWEQLPLFTQNAIDCGVEFGEILLIENADTYKDLVREFDESY